MILRYAVVPLDTKTSIDNSLSTGREAWYIYTREKSPPGNCAISRRDLISRRYNIYPNDESIVAPSMRCIYIYIYVYPLYRSRGAALYASAIDIYVQSFVDFLESCRRRNCRIAWWELLLYTSLRISGAITLMFFVYFLFSYAAGFVWESPAFF